MKFKRQYQLNEFIIRFVFSPPMIFLIGFIVGIAYESNFPGFARELVLTVYSLIDMIPLMAGRI